MGRSGLRFTSAGTPCPEAAFARPVRSSGCAATLLQDFREALR